MDGPARKNRANHLEAQICIAEAGLKRIRELSAQKLNTTPTWSSNLRSTTPVEPEQDQAALQQERQMEMQSILEGWLRRFGEVLAIASQHKDIRESAEFQNHMQTTRTLLRQGHNILATVSRRHPIHSNAKCRRIMRQIESAIDLFHQNVQREAVQARMQLARHAGLADMMQKKHDGVRRVLKRCLYSQKQSFRVCADGLSTFERCLSGLQRMVRAGNAQHYMQAFELETAAAVADFEVVRLMSAAAAQIFEAEDRYKLLKQLFASNWNSSQADTLTENIEHISEHLEWMSEVLNSFPSEAQLRDLRQRAFTQTPSQDQIASCGGLRPFVGCIVRAGRDWPRAELPLGRRGGEVLSSGALRRSGLVTRVRKEGAGLVCTVNWRGELDRDAEDEDNVEADPEHHRYTWQPGRCYEICVDEHVTDWGGGDEEEEAEGGGWRQRRTTGGVRLRSAFGRPGWRARHCRS